MPPSSEENGYVYFSQDTKPAVNSIDIVQRGFYFSQEQLEKVLELMDLVDIEVFEGYSLTKKGTLRREKKGATCPNCNSTNIGFVGNKRKGNTVNKALLDAAMVPNGVIPPEKGKTDMWYCHDCGKFFEKSRTT